MPRTDYRLFSAHCVHRERSLIYGVQLSAQPHPPAKVITVSGEIDACNCGHLGDYLMGFFRLDHPLVLDLGAVDFLGVAGLRAILRFAGECRRAERDWAVVTCDAVNALLAVAALEDPLPVVNSVEEALQQLTAVPRGRCRLQPVTGPDDTWC